MKINAIDKSLRPREKAMGYGMATLTDAELLAILIRNDTKEKGCIDIAIELLDSHGSLQDLFNSDIDALIQTKGISSVKAIELKAVMELAKRLSKTMLNRSILIDDPTKIIAYMRTHYGHENHEVLVCFYLDGADQLIEVKPMAYGSSNRLSVDIRSILHHGLTIECCGLIIAHNHPSGRYEPSNADIDFTFQLAKACELVGIDLLDHIIVTLSGAYIFSDHHDR